MMGHVAGSCVVLLIAAACSSSERARTRRQDDAAFAGAAPTEVRHVRAVGHIELVESSAAAMSIAQPGLFFTINDSGNDAVLFALDTTGANRGAWKVLGARNRDWEAAAVGPCSTSESSSPAREGWCVYVGDVGDNGEAHRESTIYRVPEPAAGRQGTADTITAEHLRFRYADGPHDVEAMYVTPNGSTVLITKRPREDLAGHLRPALVFTLPPAAWRTGGDTAVVAPLTDSLPIVPGSAPERVITDAALSPDGRRLAVRTYEEVYVFATDSATGQVVKTIRPAICDISGVEEKAGEGVTWAGGRGRLLLTSEGRMADMHLLTCPVPHEGKER